MTLKSFRIIVLTIKNIANVWTVKLFVLLLRLFICVLVADSGNVEYVCLRTLFSTDTSLGVNKNQETLCYRYQSPWEQGPFKLVLCLFQRVVGSSDLCVLLYFYADKKVKHIRSQNLNAIILMGSEFKMLL